MNIVETPFDQRVRAIRQAVFIQEQQVPVEEEFDALDPEARHWLAIVEGVAVGTVRLAKGWLGRLAVLPAFRRQGVGAALVEAVLGAARAEGLEEVRAAVQTWAVPWYEKRGWQVFGPDFDDAGIPHRRAVYRFSHQK